MGGLAVEAGDKGKCVDDVHKAFQKAWNLQKCQGGFRFLGNMHQVSLEMEECLEFMFVVLKSVSFLDLAVVGQ